MSETSGRIVEELRKLHEAGAIKSKEDASFYAHFVRMFGATFIGWPAKPQDKGGAEMTALERVLSVRDGAFLQVYCEEKGEGLKVTVSLQDVDIGDEDGEVRTVVAFEKGNLAEALEALDGWLGKAMMEAAACAFWWNSDGAGEERVTEKKKA